MDYIRGKELFDVIRDIDILSKSQTLFYGASIMLAVRYLHQRKIVYRDIKPENVMVTENGKTRTTNTGNTGGEKDIIPKVEIHKKRVKTTMVKYEYIIKITNEGDVEGYAKEITDYVPNGLKFYAEDNTGWKDEGNNVISTRLLENKLLKPGESATVKVILRWINGENNLGTKVNVAEISEDDNEKHIPDRDSTPDNKKEGEDDIDDAAVVLSIRTGLTENIMLYVGGGLIALVILAGGIVLIKKFVLK
jgi:hypothetical protein